MVDELRCHKCGAVIRPGEEKVKAGNDGIKLYFCSTKCMGAPKLFEWIVQRPKQEKK